jgi:hypothetical protein
LIANTSGETSRNEQVGCRCQMQNDHRRTLLWRAGVVAAKIVAAWLLLAFVVIPVALGVGAVAAAMSGSVETGTTLSHAVLLLCCSLLIALAVRAWGWRRVLAGVTGLVLLAGAFWLSGTVIWRDDEYRRVTLDFKAATPIAKRSDRGDGQTGWNEHIAIPGTVHANLRAGDHLSIATIRYSDETSPRQMFPPADYTNIGEIRRRGSLLYILRGITLFRTEYRLNVFDVNRRVVVADRRVDLADVK